MQKQKQKQNPPKEPIKLHAFSQEYLHYKSTLLQTLKQYHKSTLITDIYLTERCYSLTLLQQRITEVEMFGCGFKKIYHKKNVSPYLKLEKVIILTNIDQPSLKELEQIAFLFPEIYLLTLQMTDTSNAQLMRGSEIKKSIKSIKELNVNFFTFLDGAHFVSKIEKSSLFKNQQQKKIGYKYERASIKQRVGAYRSFLLGFPKIYEFELHFLKSNNKEYNNLVSNLEEQLQECLVVMQNHQNQCKNFDKTSSPRIKCLILNRQVIEDLISPLIYGYFYGPLCEEFIDRDKLIEGAQKFTSKGKMYNQLFEKDFDEGAEYIQKLTNDKTALEGPFQTNYFYKAKHIIASYEDPSPIELSLHISCWRQTRQYGESRIKPAAMQQDFANRVDEYERELSNGDCISMIKEWILESTEDEAEYITEDELMKLGMVTEMSGDLWFFHKNSIKKLFYDEERKERYGNFLQRRRVEMRTHKLRQKLQGEDRSQLYRHEPRVVEMSEKWLEWVLGKNKEDGEKINGRQSRKKEQIEFIKKHINNDIMRNRETKLVILVDGMVGFNELALLKRMIKQKSDKSVNIIVESFCNTQQYADYLTRPLQNKINSRKSN